MYEILQDPDGNLWFSTAKGVSRYDGQTFTTFTTKDGLSYNLVTSAFQDEFGYLWFGTWGHGVSRYDGQTFITLKPHLHQCRTRDFLLHPDMLLPPNVPLSHLRW